MSDYITPELISVLNNLGLKGQNLAFKLIRPWGNCKEREENQCPFYFKKGRDQIFMKVRECCKFDNGDVDDSLTEDNNIAELSRILNEDLLIDS